MLRISALAGVLVATAFLTNVASAQVGYYSGYRPNAYRELNQTGKYHGYWRDLGYGVNPQQYGVYYYPGVGVPYYGGSGYGGYNGGYGNITPAPNYYHPPRSYPFQHRY